MTTRGDREQVLQDGASSADQGGRGAEASGDAREARREQVGRTPENHKRARGPCRVEDKARRAGPRWRRA